MLGEAADHQADGEVEAVVAGSGGEFGRVALGTGKVPVRQRPAEVLDRSTRPEAMEPSPAPAAPEIP